MTQYDFTETTYPIDLLDNEEYGGNHLLIWINETQDTRLSEPERQERYVDPSAVSPRDTSVLRSSFSSNDSLRQSARTLNVLGFLLGGAVAGVPAVGGAGAVVAYSTTGALTRLAPQPQQSLRRLRTAIALHMPHKLNIRYQTQWDEANTFFLSALLSANPALQQAVQAIKKGNVNDGEDRGGTAGRGNNNPSLEGALGSLGSSSIGKGFLSNIALASPLAGDQLSSATRLANNPKKEQIFQGVAFRDFQLEYEFLARSAEEAKNIEQIIFELKYHMHPELKENTGDFLWTYPSEFDLEYIQGNSSGGVIHRHTSCILTSFEVDYTPDGLYNSLPNGEPPKIKVVMNFKELVLLDKQRIKDRKY